jgi:hypothetical protein
MTTAPRHSQHADVDGGDAAPPVDATELHGWTHYSGSDLAARAFVGTVREASGFAIRVEGVQRANGTIRRHVSIDTSEVRPDRLTGHVVLEVEAVRQLVAMLRDAADEIERLR